MRLCNTDLMRLIHSELSIAKKGATDVGFSPLRMSDLRPFSCAAEFRSYCNCGKRILNSLRIMGLAPPAPIRSSETDQANAGIARMLRGSGHALFPLAAMRNYLPLVSGTGGNSLLLRPRFRARLGLAIQWDAIGATCHLSIPDRYAQAVRPLCLPQE